MQNKHKVSLQPFVLRELDHDSGVQPMLARKELSALKEGELLNSRSVVVFGESLNREITWDVIC